MRFLILPLLLFYTAFGLDVNQDVDYWGDNKQVKEREPEVKQIKIPEKVEKVEPDNKTILKQSIKWYEEKIKREKPPVEYLYFKNPEKYAKAMREWVKWKQKKGNEVVKYQIIQGRPERISLNSIYDFLNSRGYEILYFYSDTCKYCKFTKPEIKDIGVNIPVHWIEIHKEPDMFRKWNVATTPTVIFVSAKEKKAYRYKGAFTRNELLNYIYKVIKNEEYNNPSDFSYFHK